MRYIICYDISENPIRHRIAKYLESIAWRIQRSVFTCEGNEVKMHVVKKRLLALVESAEEPRLVIAPLCSACESKLWQVGEFRESERAAFII